MTVSNINTTNFSWEIFDAIEALIKAPSYTLIREVRQALPVLPNPTQKFVSQLLASIEQNRLMQFCESAIRSDNTEGFTDSISQALRHYYDKKWEYLFADNRKLTLFLDNKCLNPVLAEIAAESLSCKLNQTSGRKSNYLARKIYWRFKAISEVTGSPLTHQDALKLALFMEVNMRKLYRMGITHFKKGKYNVPCTIHLRPESRCITVVLKGTKRTLDVHGEYKNVSDCIHIPFDFQKPAFIVADTVNRIYDNNKRLHPQKARNEIYAALVREFQLARLCHGMPGVIQAISAHAYSKQKSDGSFLFADGQPVTMISVNSERCDGVLFDLFSENLTFSSKLQLAEDIVSGVLSLHSKGICHVDLNPYNVLYVEMNNVLRAKVADLGLSYIVGVQTPLYSFKNGYYGTISATAPELFGNPDFEGDCFKLDVWALGALLYQLHFKCPLPWSRLPELYFASKTAVSAETVVNFHQEIDLFCETPLANLQREKMLNHEDYFLYLILRLLRLDPNARITLYEMLEGIKMLKRVASNNGQ